MTRQAILDTTFNALQQRFGERFTTDINVREQHSGGKAYHKPGVPDAVFTPLNTEEVAFVVERCAESKIPIVPFAAATSLEGQLSAYEGGLTIDMTKMNSVYRVSPEDLDCTVGPGITREALNDILIKDDLFFPVDAGAGATIGGMVATRASGTNTVRFGTIRENVLGLTAVLADGRIIHTGSRARKSAAGYDLTHLLIGSEGTLGIITEVTLKVQPIAQHTSVALCAFPSLNDAVNTAIEVIQHGIQIARVELMDKRLVSAVNQFSGLSLHPSDTLMFEFVGSSSTALNEQVEQVRAIATAHHASGFEWASELEEREKLWAARKDAFNATVALREGSRGWPSDVCVPVSRLAESLEFTRDLLKHTDIPATFMGHVGDGNFHVVFAVKSDVPGELEEIAAINAKMVEHALSVGGTCTGEHGIGTGKMKYLEKEHGKNAVDVMRIIKQALDPDNLLNPGKVLPAQ